MSNVTLTTSQTKALGLARRNDDFLAAGHNVFGGRLVRVSARTLDALVNRDLATACYSPDGGYAVRLTDAGRLAADMGE